jgi:hypothetical protein
VSGLLFVTKIEVSIQAEDVDGAGIAGASEPLSVEVERDRQNHVILGTSSQLLDELSRCCAEQSDQSSLMIISQFQEATFSEAVAIRVPL